MKEKVLVIDDNLDSLAIFRTILESRGFSVREAQTGEEAIAHLGDDRPDVILLDVMMPEMSGWEVLKCIKGTYSTSKIPVIMVTAKIQDDDVMTGYQYGADYYITKPCTAKQLLYGIGLVLGQVDPSASMTGGEKDDVA